MIINISNLTPVFRESASFLNFVSSNLGRAGIKGTAYTLVTEKDKEFVGHIVRNLEAANQDVTKELMELVS